MSNNNLADVMGVLRPDPSSNGSQPVSKTSKVAFQATFIKRLSWSTLLVIQSDLLGFVCSRAEADLARDVVRKYGIDSFGHYRMKIRNPDSILKEHCLCLLCTSLRSACVQDPSKLAMPGFGRSALSRLSAASRRFWVARWLP